MKSSPSLTTTTIEGGEYLWAFFPTTLKATLSFGLVNGIEISNEKPRATLVVDRVYVGDEILPLCGDYFINHYKDPLGLPPTQ